MKFFMQDEVSDKIDVIMKSIKGLMDGEVASKMKKNGADYAINYGASIIWLRKLSEKYKGDNLLAERLWFRDVRECMLLATLIAEPALKPEIGYGKWIQEIRNYDIAEQLGANLLYRDKALDVISKEWLMGFNVYAKAAIWVAWAVYLQRGGEISSEEVAYLTNLIAVRHADEPSFMQRSKGRFLRQLCRTSDDNLTLVRHLISTIAIDGNMAWLVEDVRTEIAFLDEC